MRSQEALLLLREKHLQRKGLDIFRNKKDKFFIKSCTLTQIFFIIHSNSTKKQPLQFQKRKKSSMPALKQNQLMLNPKL
jgi:hypothetical protein